MQRVIKIVFIALLFLSFSSINIFCQDQQSNQQEVQYGWSSVDNIFIKMELDKLVKKAMSGPIKIGITAKEVMEVMGVPNRIDEEGYTYYYRESPVFFDNNWKVQSWDNRYGNLDVIEDTYNIGPGSHIAEVFKEKGFPLRIIKIDCSYQLDYPEEKIYLSENWNVEAVHDKQTIKYNPNRNVMHLDDFLVEFQKYLKEN